MRCMVSCKGLIRKLKDSGWLETAYVYRYNRWTGKFKKIKIYYIAFKNLFEMEYFYGINGLSLSILNLGVQVDDEWFDMELEIKKEGKGVLGDLTPRVA